MREGGGLAGGGVAPIGGGHVRAPYGRGRRAVPDRF